MQLRWKRDLPPRYAGLKRPFVPVGWEKRQLEGASKQNVRSLYQAYKTVIERAGGFRTGGTRASLLLEGELRRATRAESIRGPSLDLCGGIGRSRPILQALGRPSVLVDLVFEQLQLAAGPRVCVDAVALPFADRSFGLIWSEDAFSHISDRMALLAECRRVIKGGGLLAFFDLIRNSINLHREERFRRAWCLSPLETNESYRCLLERSGFVVLVAHPIGSTLFQYQLLDESVRGDLSPRDYARWLWSNRGEMRDYFGNDSLHVQLERLRMYWYLADGRLDYLLAVCQAK